MRPLRIGLLIVVATLALLAGAVQGTGQTAPALWPIATPEPLPAHGPQRTDVKEGVALSMRSTRRPSRSLPDPLHPQPLAYGQTTAGWVTILSENFEGGFPGVWDVWDDDSDHGDYYWGKRNCRAYGGSYSGWAVGGGADGSFLACGQNYPDYVDSWMQYGPFSLEDASAADLTFKLWLNTETGYDTFFWGVSADGQNFYRSASEPPASGSTGGWVDKALDLNNVAGLGSVLGQPEVWIALVFTTDFDTNFAEGAYVDNIVLRKYVPSAATPTRTPVVTPTPTTPIPSWTLLYEDDFNDPVTGWPVGTWQCMNTAYEGGEFVVEMMCAGYIPLRLLLDVSDFDFRLDARWVVEQQDVSFAQLFRIMDEGRSFYWFEVAPNAQSYSLWLVHDGNWSQLIGEAFSPHINQGTARNSLRVVGVGSSFQLYINGQQVGSFSDATLPIGGTGFAVYNYNQSGVYPCAFDNYQLWGQTSQEPTPIPTPTRTRTPTLPPGELRRVYLPVALRRFTAGVVGLTNGSFENGDLSGWQQGGDLSRRVVGDVVHLGRVAALLGNPEAGPCSARVGQAWIEQEFNVPSAGSPKLSLWYRLRTYDRNRDLVDTIDYFDVLLNGQRVHRDANRTLTNKCDGDPHDLGWKEFVYDLDAYRGQRVRVRLLLASTDQWWNTWVYLDDVALIQ